MKRVIIFCLIIGLLSMGAVASAQSKTWEFDAAGCFPRHLPDAFMSTINVNDLNPPEEIQGVYKFDDDLGQWKFWAKDAPGCTLEYLEGGTKADYMVCTIGACQWDFSLRGRVYYPMYPANGFSLPEYIEGAEITMGGQTVYSDEDGYYDLLGSGNMTVTHPWILPISGECSVMDIPVYPNWPVFFDLNMFFTDLCTSL